MDKKFMKWYRKRYEDISAAPPEGLWSDIRVALDEQRRKERKRVAAWLFSSAASLLITACAWFWLSGQGTPSSTGGFSSWCKVPVTNHMFSLQAGFNSSQVIAAGMDRPFVKKVAINLVNNDGRSLSKEKVLQVASQQNEYPGRQQVSASPGKLDLRLPKSDIVVSSISPGPEFKGAIQLVESTPVAETKVPKFFLGLTVNYNNTWVVNSNLWSAAQQNSFSYVDPYYSASASLLAGYAIGKRKKVFAEPGLYRMGQRYYEYQEGHLRQYELSLHYANLNSYVSFESKERITGANLRSSFSFLAGVHTAYLLSASERWEKEGTADVRDDYKKFNGGILIGGAYNVRWKTHVGMSAGLRSNIGLMNVYSGCNELPSALNRTFNQNLSVFTSLYYAF